MLDKRNLGAGSEHLTRSTDTVWLGRSASWVTELGVGGTVVDAPVTGSVRRYPYL